MQNYLGAIKSVAKASKSTCGKWKRINNHPTVGNIWEESYDNGPADIYQDISK